MNKPQPHTPLAPKTESTVTTITRKIGLNRGKARLWIEGVSLESQGWVKGTMYTAVFASPVVSYCRFTCADTLTNQVRKVAGTDLRPIIDTNTDKLLDALDVEVGDTVTIIITRDIITVRKFNPATDAKAEKFVNQRKPV